MEGKSARERRKLNAMRYIFSLLRLGIASLIGVREACCTLGPGSFGGGSGSDLILARIERTRQLSAVDIKTKSFSLAVFPCKDWKFF